MDRISYLLDPLRTHIVSFLPMEDAFRTSVLSTQWRHVCSSLTHLKFDQIAFEAREYKNLHFKDFVDQILVRHDASDVEKFQLTVDFDDKSDSLLDSWVSFAVQHKVKEFDLSLIGKLETPPNVLFTCKTLTVLKMYGSLVTSPAFIGFPMLKTMILEEVRFLDANKTNQLISTCPMLQDLTFLRCFWLNTSDPLIISAPNLKILQVYLYNPSPDVKICTPNLNQMTYSGNPPVISSDTLSSVAKATIMYFSSSLKLTKVASDHTSNIVMALRNVVYLSLDMFCLEFLIRDRDLLSRLPTSCCSLKSLNINIAPTKFHAEVVPFLLKSYPNLESLLVSFLFMGVSSYKLDEEGRWQSQKLSSETALNNLKRVKIEWFGGSDCELDLLKHLLENASILEDMRITYSSDLEKDIESQKSIHQKLVQLQKASTSATISYPSIDLDELKRGATDDLTAVKILRKLMARMG